MRTRKNETKAKRGHPKRKRQCPSLSPSGERCILSEGHTPIGGHHSWNDELGPIAWGGDYAHQLKEEGRLGRLPTKGSSLLEAAQAEIEAAKAISRRLMVEAEETRKMNIRRDRQHESDVKEMDELARFFVFFMEECGTSSKAMVRYIFTGVAPSPIEHPLDNDDWYRCVRALMVMPGVGDGSRDERLMALVDMSGWDNWKQDMIRVVDIRKQLDEFHRRI